MPNGDPRDVFFFYPILARIFFFFAQIKFHSMIFKNRSPDLPEYAEILLCLCFISFFYLYLYMSLAMMHG